MKLRGFSSWFRFRLRTLLLVFTAVSIWLGFHVQSTRLQRQSAAAIAEYGGWLRYDFQFPAGDYSHKGFDPKARSRVPNWLLERLGVDFFHDVVQVSLNYSEDSGKREENKNPSDEALQYLRGFPNLRVLLLSDTQASDSSMRHLTGLSRLEYLFMWDATAVTDAGVAHLRELKRLRYIHLSSSQITDKSLAVFAKLPDVKGLSLQFNHFTDDGLERVARLEELESLWVCGKVDRENKITDVGLKRIVTLKHLTTLGIQHTEVTSQGVDEFSRAVPGCKILR